MRWLEKFVVLEKRSADVPTPETRADSATPSSPPASAPAGDFDLTDVYRQKGISPLPFTAEHALDLLSSLPKAFRGETKRQGLIDLLEENSTSPAAVAEDARRKIDALTAAADSLPGAFADFIADTQNEIAKLEAAIQEKREAVETAQVEGEKNAQQCRAEAERLKTLLQFLG
jgi:hypothetical protein